MVSNNLCGIYKSITMKSFIAPLLFFLVESSAKPQTPSGLYLPALTGTPGISPRLSEFMSGSLLQSGATIPSIPTGSYLPSEGEDTQAYFFTTPHEEEVKLRINIIPTNRKQTKLVFVKAPSAAVLKTEIVAPPSVSEVKTLVYVLSKKPEYLEPINIPAHVTQIQTKPEIVYVKYNNLQEAEQAIQQSLAGQSAPGVQPTNLQTFLNNLGVNRGGGDLPVGIGLTNGGSNILSVTGGGKGEQSGQTVVDVSSLGGGITSISSDSKFGPAGESGPY